MERRLDACAQGLTEGSPLFVVGMHREARIAPARAVVGAAGLAGAGLAGVQGLISFGICGALDPTVTVGDLIIADGVAVADGRLAADAAWTGRLHKALPAARRGYIAGVDRIAASAREKAALHATTGAIAVDMESHAIALAARAAGLNFAVVRAVSDDADRDLPRAAQAGFRTDGAVDVGAVIAALARRPWELVALIRVALEAEAAFRALRAAAAAMSHDCASAPELALLSQAA